ncbi:MAG: aminotransferase class V-fold PLP-dependent enzyme [Proteobacteria bacterium]|nr:aminotransferase class V-fold PLP-dependent enzyme [Pseudomonadota bacterium]
MYALGSQRPLFDIPDGVAYFNTAYNGPLLNASRERLVAAAGAKSRPWERTPADFFADAERLRVLAAGLFGADADGWAIIPASSYGVSTAARAVEPSLRPGDRVLLLDEEFPSNVLPWRRVARETGAEIVTVPTPQDFDWTGAVLAALAPDVRVASLAPCHWTNGARLDLARIGEACRAHGTILVVDATQSLGAMPLDLQAIAPDFLVASGYKWLLCPYGFSLLYVAPAWRDARPLEETWLARANAEDFAGLVRYSDEYRSGARRFDMGETCVTTVLPGAVAALEQLTAWGVPAIAESLGAVNARLIESLETLGFKVAPATQRCPHLFGARLPDGVGGDVVGALRSRGVYISQRGASLRFAPHLHVTEADIAKLFEALEATAA